MTDQEFDNCKQALLMAAKMICDQDVETFWAEAWRRANANVKDEQKHQIARIASKCLDLSELIDRFSPPSKP